MAPAISHKLEIMLTDVSSEVLPTLTGRLKARSFILLHRRERKPSPEGEGLSWQLVALFSNE